MTIRNTMKWLLAAALAAGCSATSVPTPTSGANQNVSVTPPASPTSEVPVTPVTPGSEVPVPPGVPCDFDVPNTAFIRLQGVNNLDGYTNVSVDVAHTEVWVDGEPVPVDDSTDVVPINLATAETPFLVGRFALPPAGHEVKVRLRFDDYGAFENTSGGAIDLRGLPIEFTVPSDWFQWQHHAIIWLDLSRSIVQSSCDAQCGGEEKVLLPALEIWFW